jgi:hypothetical protein
MKNYNKRNQLIDAMSDRFPALIEHFDDSYRLHALSILALAIIKIESDIYSKSLGEYEAAISHITQQESLSNYETLSFKEKSMVDIFAISEVAKQHHKVISTKVYLSTQSRILDAYGHSSETTDNDEEPKRCSGFLNGFTSLKNDFLGLVKSVLSAKPGGKDE